MTYTAMVDTSTGPICIIGMHRSGTSMVARLLNLSGLTLGTPEHLMDPNEANPVGYFEHKGFLEVNEALLAHFGGSWIDPPKLREGWEGDPNLSKFHKQAKSLLGTFSMSTCWGWKDPRTTVLVPFWTSLIPNLRFVICVRNPLEVARSLKKRDDISIGAGMHLWGRYMRAGIEYTEAWPRLFTFYEDYFYDPLGEADRVARFCGLEKPANASIIHEAISGELRHHESETLELLTVQGAPSEEKLFYLCLRALLRQHFVSDGLETASSDGAIGGVLAMLRLFDELHNQENPARLQHALTEMEHQLDSVRVIAKENLMKKEYEVSQLQVAVAQLRATVGELQRQNEKLQAFANAVRATLVYRLYQKVLKPFVSD